MTRRHPTILPLLLALGLLTPAALAEAIPKVVLSDHHKEMCKVGVGDSMPMKVTTGKAATVVAFVRGKGWMTRQLLKDLGPDVAKPFRGKGVETVVMFVDEEPAKSDAYAAVADPDGKEFAKVGNGALPRVYVLDSKGKIAWFDLEYSRATRRELRQTLTFLTNAK